MAPGCRAELGGVALFAAGCGVVASLAPRPSVVLLVGVFAYLAWTLLSLRRFLRWLWRGADVPPPRLYGAWSDLVDSVQAERRAAAREQDDLRAAVRESRDSLAALRDGVLILGPNDDIRWCNPAATGLLGLRYPQDVGQALTNLVRDPDLGIFLEQGEFDKAHELQTASRPQRILELRVAEFGAANKIIFVRDVTALRRLETVRRDFVANVSHELRTPLTVINGYLETLLSVDLQPKEICDRALGQMQQQAQRMSNLIRDLMTLAIMESGRDEGQETEVIALRPLLDGLCEGAMATAKGPRDLRLECPAELSFRANRAQLETIFANLIVNAVKYTRDGGRITVRCTKEGYVLDFAVIDNGIGIDPVHIPRLTERFYRVDQSRSLERGGTGLGLAIVKHALRLCHGELEIESTPGKGSTFRCRIPQPESQVSPAA